MGYAWIQTAITLVACSVIGLSISFSGAALLAPLRSRLMVFFGLVSYALYMLHMFILQAYDHFFGVPTASAPVSAYWLRVATVLAVSILASHAEPLCD